MSLNLGEFMFIPIHYIYTLITKLPASELYGFVDVVSVDY